MQTSRAILAFAVTLATVHTGARSASAEGPQREPDAVARAEARFHEGERLFDDKHYAEACTAFDESEHLDPQLGTLLNLAFCQETLGKTASAWRDYDTGAVWAEQRGQHDRAAWALTRALELSKKLSLVLLDVPTDAADDVIAIDGDAIAGSTLATPLPLDPGVHHLHVSAPGRLDQQLDVTVPEGPSTLSVTIPVLALAPAPRPVVVDAAPPGPPPGRNQTIVGLVVLGVGVASLGVGTVYGALTLSKKSDAEAHCTGTECDATGVSLQDEAHRDATVSTIAFGVGIATVAAGAWLALTAPSGAPSPARARLQPLVGPHVAALGMVGVW